jgi:organic hydroperoxide reductase OsmC/OhrA
LTRRRRAAKRFVVGGPRKEREVHRYEARVRWTRDGAVFTDNRYSRAHRWTFDGGVTVPASASPSVVPPPRSVAEAVDPEEALVAAASSCHMLTFLSIAAAQGFVVESYDDAAVGLMDKDGDGRTSITRIALRPAIAWAPGKAPSSAELEALHHAAHDECFIANSLKSEIVVEAPEIGR